MAMAEMIDEVAQPVRTALEIEIAAGLRAARKSAGLTLKDVGERCGTTPQTIQRLETANMTLSVEWVGRLCDAIDITPFELFAGCDSRLESAVQLIRRARRAAQHLDLDLQETRGSLKAFLEKIGDED